MNKKETPDNQQEMTFDSANTADSNTNNTPTSTQQNNNQPAYTDDNIRHLSDMEHVRTRPGMYIGRFGDGT